MAKNSRSSSSIDKMVMNFAQLSTALVSFTIGTTLLILLANLFFPKAVVLGHHSLSAGMGAVYAAFVVSLIAVGVIPVVESWANQQKMQLTNVHWILMYWAIDASAIWMVGRFAELVGMGLSSWLVAVVLGMVVNLAQGSLMMNVVSKVKST